MSKKKMELNRIREVLDGLGKTQVWLAEQLDVEFKTVNRWCGNIKQPPLERLSEIAKVLKVSPRDLLN